MGESRTYIYDPEPVLTDSREPKLPQWAQEMIRGLRSQVVEARSLVRSLQAETPADGAPIVIDPYGDAPTGIVERGMRIGFRIDGRANGLITIYREDDGSVDISSSRGAIVVEPRASNSIRVRGVE